MEYVTKFSGQPGLPCGREAVSGLHLLCLWMWSPGAEGRKLGGGPHKWDMVWHLETSWRSTPFLLLLKIPSHFLSMFHLYCHSPALAFSSYSVIFDLATVPRLSPSNLSPHCNQTNLKTLFWSWNSIAWKPSVLIILIIKLPKGLTKSDFNKFFSNELEIFYVCT